MPLALSPVNIKNILKCFKRFQVNVHSVIFEKRFINIYTNVFLLNTFIKRF